MATNIPVQHKRSSTASNTPSAAQLEIGEIAINFADKKIYTKDASNNIILIGSADDEVVISTTAPTGASLFEGVLWYNTTSNFLQVYNGSTWDPVQFTGNEITTGNTSFAGVNGAPSGSGTIGSPYGITATVSSGETTLVDTVTITGLQAGQLVSITDTNSAANGGRIWVNNNIANASGTLIFNIYCTDLPASANGTTYTPNLKIGNSSVYIGGTFTSQSVFPQTLNYPQDTNSVSTFWSSPNTTLTSTGDIRLSTNNATFSTSISVNSGDTIYTKWNGAAGSGVGIDSAHGTTISGVVTASYNSATNTASLTVDKSFTFSFTDQFGLPQSSNVFSNVVTATGINSYAYVTGTTDGINLRYSKNGNGYAAVPTSGTSVSLVKDDQIQFRLTTGGTAEDSDTATITIGQTTDAWSVTTADAGGGIVDKPVILTPTDGGTNISTGVSITTTNFASVAGTHVSTDWEVYTDAALTTLFLDSIGDTLNLVSWTPPGLGGNTTYHVRVRHTDSAANTSEWSQTVSFTTLTVGGFITLGNAILNPGAPFTAYTASAGTVPRWFSNVINNGVTINRTLPGTSADFRVWSDSILSRDQEINIRNANSVVQSLNGNVYLAQINNKPLASTDGGVSWSRVGDSGCQYGLGSRITDTVIMVGGINRFVGTSFSKPITGESFSCVANDGVTNDWYVFNSTDYKRSTNDGVTWTDLTTNGTPPVYVGGSCFTNGTTFYGWVWGSSATTVHSLGGPSNGLPLAASVFSTFNPSTGTTTELFQNDQDSDYGPGAPIYQQVYNLNGGQNSIVVSFAQDQYVNSTDITGIAKTNDGGATWTNITVAVDTACGGRTAAIGSDGEFFYASGTNAIKFI